VGAIGLAAVFSAEISASDAILFMLTTSLSRDFYQRFVNSAADDRQVLRVARWTAVASGTLGTLLAIALGSVVNALTIFYTLIGVSLFVPVVAGLYVGRTSSAGALMSMVTGVASALGLHFITGGRGWGLMTPASLGLATAIGVWVISLAAAPNTKSL
jgi:SSS family solute:Na+ symporter